MDERHSAQRHRWAIVAASVIAPLAAVLLSLQYRSDSWLLIALAVGAAVSVVLAELGSRDAGPAAPATRPAPGTPLRVVSDSRPRQRR
jgi:hypothetical protein